MPGTWVLAPQVGFLWTPGWWGWGGEGFIFHEGYWGPRVGFYGGINYGFGYFGNGYEGGRWDGDRFFYNRSVTNVNVTNIHNVYNTTIINNNVTRVSYNGGQGGLNARPTPEQQNFDRERHMGPVAAQTQHIQEARGNQELRASVNHGKPPIAATERPGDFRQHAVPAREAGGPYQPGNRGEANRGNAPRPGGEVPRPPTHARDITPHQQFERPNTGNARQDQKYAQQQQKLYAKQQQEHQKMVQKQEQDHQQLQQQEQRAQQNQARQHQYEAHQQQMEQRHAQQTQQMEQRHMEQQQHMQQRQQPHTPPHNEGGPSRR